MGIFQKTLYHHAKKYKLYHIRLLDAQKVGFKKKSSVKRTQGRDNIALTGCEAA